MVRTSFGSGHQNCQWMCNVVYKSKYYGFNDMTDERCTCEHKPRPWCEQQKCKSASLLNVSSLSLGIECEQPGLSLTWSEKARTGFFHDDRNTNDISFDQMLIRKVKSMQISRSRTNCENLWWVGTTPKQYSIPTPSVAGTNDW